MSEPSIVALIPARAGSKRIQGKNIKPLAGYPLLAYTVAAAHQSGVFAAILVSSDSGAILETARNYGPTCGLECPLSVAHKDMDADIQWVEHAFQEAKWARGISEADDETLAEKFDAFAILRPTSPFRTADTIHRAWQQWLERGQDYDSMRAVEPVQQHPCKVHSIVSMSWSGQECLRSCCDAGRLHGYYIPSRTTPHHSSPTQSLPKLYAQNASLEIAWTKTVTEKHSISGALIMPFFTEGYEGINLDTMDDWYLAETLIERGLAKLPEVGLVEV